MYKGKKLYWNGKKAEYTGKKEVLYGTMFFEIRILEGHLRGQIKETSRCPECGLVFGQDQPALNPCFECMVNEGVV